MRRTHAYLSCLVSVFPGGVTETLVKTRTLCAEQGWLGEPRIEKITGNPKFSVLNIPDVRRYLRDEARPVAEEVPTEVLVEFGKLSMLVALAHGEGFPTWVGDLYIQPSSHKLGSARIHRFLITEAPGLDCGTWEEDCVPVRDA